MEEIGEILSRGFGVWKSNLNLCMPFLLNIMITMVITVPFIAAISSILLPQESLNSLNEATLQNETALNELLAQMAGSLESLPADRMLLVAGLFFVLIVLISLADAFFTAGAIGMARKAQEDGRTDIGAMWSAGRSHFLRLFLATLAIGLITMAGLVFLLPALVMNPQPLSEDPQAMGLLAAGFLIFIFYALAISMVLAAAPFALVLGNLGARQAISASINFFRYNKFDVAVLWLVVVALSIGLQMIGSAAPMGSGTAGEHFSFITNLINLLVLYPLSNLWWTRLYMNRMGMLSTNEVNDPW
jgi:hypothetical protein